MEVLYRQAGDRKKQIRLQFGNYILERVLAEIGEVHERRNAGGELDQLFLHQLALGLVFLFLVGEFLLLLGRQVLFLGLVLERLDLVALIDDGLDDVVAERAPTLDALHGGHRVGVVHDAPERVVIHVHQQRALPLARQQRGRGARHCDVEDAARVDLRHVRAVVGQHGQECGWQT